MQEYIMYFKRTYVKWFIEQWYWWGEFSVELCTICSEAFSLMSVTILMFPRVKMKKIESLLSLEKNIMMWHQRLGRIGDERGLQALQGKIWLKVCLIAHWILIFVNIVYMVSKIEWDFFVVLQRQKGSCIWYMLMCFVLYLFHHWEDLCIMFPL